jgi:hypothetical protein
MHLYQARRLIVLIIIASSLIILLLVWLRVLSFYNPPIDSHSHSHTDTLLATIIPTTATFGAVALAVVFLTAQLSAAAGRSSVLRELYRGSDIYILFTYLSVTLLIGYVALAIEVGPSNSVLGSMLINFVLVLASTSALLVLPTLMSQVENLDPIALAAKLSMRTKPRAIKDYGLTHVEFVSSQPNTVKYYLSTVGLRPRSIDPLRPLHELFMEAVKARDRVLFGKLFRYLLKLVAQVHGAYWDPKGNKVVNNSRFNQISRLRAKRYDLCEKIHMTLAILHYSVKRARNLLTEWENRDIGRHGILTGVGDLIRSLAKVDNTNTAIRICLYATLHITGFYSNVEPYGRIEPLNAYFLAADELLAAGKKQEAELCIEILGWASTHTSQLSSGRSAGLEENLSENLRQLYLVSQENSENNQDWLPGGEEDPWRNWP